MSIVKRLIEDIIKEKTFERTEDFKPTVFYPSEVGHCLRKLFFKRVSLEKRGYVQFSERTAKQFVMGEAVHYYIENKVLERYGSEKKIEREIDVTYRFLDIDIRGHLDIINHTDKELVEIKSTSRDLRTIESIARRQLNLYLHRYPDYHGYVFIVNRATGEYIEVDSYYDPDMFLADIELFRKVLKAWRLYEKNGKTTIAMYKAVSQLPPCSKPWVCKDCPFLEFCMVANTYHD